MVGLKRFVMPSARMSRVGFVQKFSVFSSKDVTVLSESLSMAKSDPKKRNKDSTLGQLEFARKQADFLPHSNRSH